MRLESLAHGRRDLALDVLGQCFDIRRRRRAAGVPMMFSSNQAPRSTGEVLFGYEDAISTPPLPSKPQRAVVRELDAAKARRREHR